MTYTIALIGLTNSGRSSIVNSLIGKCLLNTGIYQTTIIDLPRFSKDNDQYEK